MSLSHALLQPQGTVAAGATQTAAGATQTAAGATRTAAGATGCAPRIIDTASRTTALPVLDLGIAPYAAVQGLQQRLRAHVADGRIPGVLLLLEHLPVITLGSRGSVKDLRRSTRSCGHAEVSPGPEIPVVVSERGGAATLHAPGQLVSYPIWTIPGRDLGRYVFNLEDVLAHVLDDHEIYAERIPGRPGLYVNGLKIASVGLRCQRWVASHGTSLNVTIELSLFDRIVACGEADRRQTSIAALTGCAPSMESVKEAYARHFQEVMSQMLQPQRILDHTLVERELGLEADVAG